MRSFSRCTLAVLARRVSTTSTAWTIWCFTTSICVTTLRLESPVLLGTSLGGWFAAEWAVRYPDMLRGLILVDALGLRLPEAPATDLLRLDAAQTRPVLLRIPRPSGPRIDP